MRSALTATLDERALALALAAIAERRPGALRQPGAGVAQPTAASRRACARCCWQAPRAARLIWLEVAEVAAVEHFELLRELGRQLRPTGARLGLEHAGERLGRIERLFEARARLRQARRRRHAGRGRDEHARRLRARPGDACCTACRCRCIAEGVTDAADAKALWQCGVDGADRPVGQRAASAGAGEPAPRRGGVQGRACAALRRLSTRAVDDQLAARQQLLDDLRVGRAAAQAERVGRSTPCSTMVWSFGARRRRRRRTGRSS